MGVLDLRPARSCLSQSSCARAELAHAFELHDVDQADEVNAFVIEAVPAVAGGALAVAREVELAVVDRGVVLAGNVEDLALGSRQELVERVELGGLRSVREIAGVDDEIRHGRAGVDLVERELQRCGDVGVGGLVEADVAVADLDKGEVGLLFSVMRLAESARDRNASGEGPDQAGAGPGHAFQKTAAVDAVVHIAPLGGCPKPRTARDRSTRT